MENYLTPESHLPKTRTIEQQVSKFVEDNFQDAAMVLKELLHCSLAEIRFKTATYIVNKASEKNDPLSFVLNKSREELIGMVAGSGILEKILEARLKKEADFSSEKIVDAEIVTENVTLPEANSEAIKNENGPA